MARIAIVDSQKLSSEVVNIQNDIKELFGVDFVPNFFKVLSNNEDVLSGLYLMNKKLLHEGKLPNSLKEMIFLTLALRLKCNYCASIHYAKLHDLDIGEAEDLVTDISLIKNLLVRKVLLFSIKVMESPRGVTDVDIKELEKVGLSKAEIIEAIAVASFSSSIVKTSLALKVQTDDEIKEYLEGKNIELKVA